MTPTLEAVGLRAGYREVEVLQGVDLHVSRGEIVALFGPNGAGKTTTLLALARLLSPRGGTVTWNGDARPVPAHRLARDGLTLVAERSVFQRLSVAANLRLSRGDPARAIEIFPELRPLLKRRAGLLSGGEQQMLALGRALAGNPKILMIDELSLGLAPTAVDRLLSAVRRIAAGGVGVLLVEQQVARALSVVDRGYVLQRGSIVLAGDQAELRSRQDEIKTSYLA